MKERGMIFNGEMVRAILDGRKTQTRRIMKVQPEPSKSRPGDFWFSSKKLESMVHVSELVPGNSPIADCHLFFQEHCCPFGAAGDRIWVRETFTGNYLDDDQIQDIKDGRDKASDLCEYRADYPDGYQVADGWTPSIHMPRWASRILLEITGVRVERLRDLSEDDAKSEGITPPSGGVLPGWEYRINFRDLWMSIYGADNWEANPWVWVIEFKVVPNVQDNPS
ncbi:hypothetical protein NLN84_05855 [Citrobacter portucalensis]|uniref:hypothetical protein n=1 Tax=Citrobacter portucalensis TaxID=1639133 RepID=UPI00226AFF00|nr:hypothetical protein [Citrobacter portucalensis]MCX9065112.1 hypothetical protein [Citrobacter portucalensis]